MTSLRLAAVTAIALSFAAPAYALDIYNENGGSVAEYAKRFDHASLPIRILGACKSACTLALAYPGTCVGTGSSLVFHTPVTSASRTANARMARWLFGQYPASVRAWIRSQGGLTSQLITLQGAELHRRIPTC